MSKRFILGLTGYAGVGKDEAAKALVADGWTRVAFADAVREGLLALNPGFMCGNEYWTVQEAVGLDGFRSWDRAKQQLAPLRELLQQYGTEAGRMIHGDDCWVRIAQRKIDAAPGNVVLTDVRFPNEVAICDAVVRIERPGVGPVNSHVSDCQQFPVDAVIENSGDAAELARKIREVAAAAQNVGTCG